MTRAARRAVMLGAAAACAAAALLVPVRPCLVLRTQGGRTAAVIPLAAGEPAFVLSWRHSVTLQPCADWYRSAPGGGMELYKTVFKGTGAGLPFGVEEGVTSIRDGAIVVEGMSRVLPRLELIALPLTEHAIEAGGRRWDVLALSGGAHRVTLAIERMPLGAMLSRAAPR
jgi:hypothetical protein